VNAGIKLEDSVSRRADAAQEFDKQEGRDDGHRIANSLAYGLNLLRSSFFERVHDDVELDIGADSMLMPVSALKAQQTAQIEIEIFQVAEAARAAIENEMVHNENDWFTSWLARLRLGDAAESDTVQRRLKSYLKKPADDRRLRFADVMSQEFPESRRAPLVLFRLFPLCVQLATAIAFEDHFMAAEIRNRQAQILPILADCQECHAAALENGEKCRECGNPLWKYSWLTEAD